MSLSPGAQLGPYHILDKLGVLRPFDKLRVASSKVEGRLRSGQVGPSTSVWSGP
jgi:hypothetical protein